MEKIYDPFKFIKEVELLTLAFVGSFITIKFLNAIYENVYEPITDIMFDSNKTEKYYLKIGNNYVQIGTIIKEIIKWVILVFILMIIYNIINHRFKKIEN